MWIDRIEMDFVGASISLKCKPNHEQSHCQHEISLFTCFPRCLEYRLHLADGKGAS